MTVQILCSCRPEHLELGAFDRGCPRHDIPKLPPAGLPDAPPISRPRSAGFIARYTLLVGGVLALWVAFAIALLRGT